MARNAIDDDVLAAVRELSRPASFGEIAAALADKGITKSQVHNAVYRLGQRGGLEKMGSSGRMLYRLPQS